MVSYYSLNATVWRHAKYQNNISASREIFCFICHNERQDRLKISHRYLAFDRFVSASNNVIIYKSNTLNNKRAQTIFNAHLSISNMSDQQHPQ
eukprot:UN03616